MTLMSPTHYLPSEELRYANYPELYEVQAKLDDFQKRLEPIMLAVNDFDQGAEDYIYVNIADVKQALDLSYELTDFLGSVEKVCFEVLIPLREAQEALQELIFSFGYERSRIVVDRQRTAMQRVTEDIE